MASSSFMSIACHWKRVSRVLRLKEENSSSSFQSEFGQISSGTLPRKSSWSGNTSMLRKDVGSIRVARARSRLQLVEAALASGIESSGDASTSSLDHELLQVRGVKYRPPGTAIDLLNDVSLSLSEKSLGLVYGRSGSGKTTLLQVLAGLATPTEGSIILGKDSTEKSLSSKVGIVFQFPERYFVADTVLEELTFGWPRRMEDMLMRQQLAMRLQAAVFAVGMADIPFDTNPRALSGGYKRRLALAVQLVRMPDLLLLDEPLAGLDWKARADVVKLLWGLKKECTIIIVSHDLKELTPLVDRAWHMEMGGVLKEKPWPPGLSTD
ncbi:ABC transporter I family member 11, chloroplastic isoform X2 [Physcomitrium patens]|uniref:ABC transporter domain-containing protein n=1 Tax=Physcomitrium patens TaxID=3218 RepID=A0A2K1KW40_PHYPA|nr:ABC transporter I family member 11, chloroplastic-like isoform X2 [Physcomitrium patens]PNR57966.1 hypothetical protein PHYPA_004960 [Physcomitrium patens]|eukprot:XP_024369396.1 ABC transporter I family member 11, chloroplastic-like isoform X2 [Physcomitrella patens]